MPEPSLVWLSPVVGPPLVFQQTPRAVTGTPQQVADEIKRRVLDVGIDGVIVNLPTHRYTPGVITKVGEALKPLISA